MHREQSEPGDPTYSNSARAATRESLPEGEERFRALADNIAQLAWMADETGWIFWYNERWFEYTGTDLAQMEGWGWQAVHHADHVDRVTENFKRCIAAGEVWEDTFPLRGKDGVFRWFLSRAHPIRDRAGKVTRWFGTNTDITDRMRMEEALKEADQRKDTFMATLGHELRNPLATIVHGIQLLSEIESTPDQRRTVTRLVRDQVEHMTRLVDDLIEVSRITRGKITLRRQRVDLAQTVGQCVRDQELSDRRGRSRFRFRAPEGPVWIDGDATRLKQVVGNLLSNACKFSGSDDPIDVELMREGGRAALRVTDRGIGMDESTLSILFEPFAQADEADASGRAGLGLGLALVRGLVELHGGEVSAHSDGLGRGSTLTVWLPMTEAGEAEAEAASPIAPVRRALRVLLVEDSAPVAMTFSMVLEQMGHAVEVASNGRAALAAIERERPEVVVSDISMPGMDGYELARRVRAQDGGAGLVLVASSGFCQQSDIDRAREAGFDEYLVKPADLSQIRELLDGIAARLH